MAMMKDLRVYVNPEAAEDNGEQKVFYSRRRDGPYYCWRYEARRGGWYSLRILPSDRQVKELYPASWKALPPALLARLEEYYIE